MCIILDTNMRDEYLDHKNKDLAPVRKWIAEGGRILFSDIEEFREESTRRFDKFMFENRLAIKKINSEKVKNEIEKIKKEEKKKKKSNILKTNDIHIIALAKISKAKVLVSHDDGLGDYFKSIKANVKRYQNKTHKKLLTKDICP